MRPISSSTLVRASASTSRTSFTPADVADNWTKWALVSSATRRASVVLPVPGGPHRIIETGRPASSIVRKAAPGLSRSC